MADETDVSKLTQPTPVAATTLPEHKRSWILRFLDSTWGVAAGVAATLGTGAVVARDQIGKAAFKVYNSPDVRAFKDLQKVRDDIISKATKDAQAGIIKDATPIVRRARNDYAKQFKARKDKLGLTSFVKEWEVIGGHQRKEVIMTAMGATAIAIGAVLAIATSRQGDWEREQIEKEKNHNGVHR